MVKLNAIKKYLDTELKIKGWPDHSKNGLQIRCKDDVYRIGFAVDSCLTTFEKAKRAKVDLLIVHHGLKWHKQKYKDLTKKREDFLKKNNISLYGVHLPLDGNGKYGNNIGLIKIAGAENPKLFHNYQGKKIGFKGIFSKPVSINTTAKRLNNALKTKSKVYSFGKKQIRSIGIVSGGGAEAIGDCVKEKLDCFVVGEIPLSAYHRAKDYKLNMIVAGHYATETVGVNALMKPIKERFEVDVIFIENFVNL